MLLETLKKDFSRISVLKIVNILLKFSVSVLFVRLLGIEARGVFFKLSQIGGIISFFLCLSIGDYFIYNINRGVNNTQLFLKTFVFVSVSIISVIIISFFVTNIQNVSLSMFILTGTSEYLYFSYLKSMRKYSYLTGLIIVKNVLLILLCWTWNASINYLIFTYCILSFSIICLVVFRIFRFSDFSVFNKFELKELFSYSRNVHVNNIFTDFENKADILIVAFFLSPREIGMYSVVVVLSQSVNNITNLLTNTIGPHYKNLSQRMIVSILKVSLVVAIIFTTVMLIFGNFILRDMYGIVDNNIYTYLSILSIALVPETLSRVYVTHYKFTEDNHVLSKISIFTSLLNIILNFAAIPYFGLFAVVIVSLVTYSIRFLYFYIHFRNKQRITSYWYILPNKETLVFVRDVLKRKT
jgi:O-antigen/teichoic acid export membrane protein